MSKTPKAPYVPPTLQKEQLLQEVLGQTTFTTHSPSPSPTGT
jgi:hypothetical protein